MPSGNRPPLWSEKLDTMPIKICRIEVAKQVTSGTDDQVWYYMLEHVAIPTANVSRTLFRREVWHNLDYYQ